MQTVRTILVVDDEPAIVHVLALKLTLNGMQLAAALRTDPRTAKIPVIILTARGHLLGDNWEDASNVRQVLAKPFSPRALAEIVGRLLPTTSNGDALRGAA